MPAQTRLARERRHTSRRVCLAHPTESSAPRNCYVQYSYGRHRNRRAGEVLPRLPEERRACGRHRAGCSAASTARSRPSAASILTVEQGEFVAFLGPNGAGKTTTLKLLSGVITPTGGTARVLGFVPWQRENAYRRRFALVMGQKNQLWWDLPAAESFRLHQQIYRIEPEQFERTPRRADRPARRAAACSRSRSASCRWASG